MRLKVPSVSANEQLVALVNRGYSVLRVVREDYVTRKESGAYSKDTECPGMSS